MKIDTTDTLQMIGMVILFVLCMFAMAYTLCWEGLMPDEPVQSVQTVQINSIQPEPIEINSMDDLLQHFNN